MFIAELSIFCGLNNLHAQRRMAWASPISHVIPMVLMVEHIETDKIYYNIPQEYPKITNM